MPLSSPLIKGRSGKKNKSRGDEAKTRRSKDGTWAKKGKEFYFGYKLHNKVDVGYGLIRAIETTTASGHDNQVDLSAEGEPVYSSCVCYNRSKSS
jgi:IS5 family transposase